MLDNKMVAILCSLIASGVIHNLASKWQQLPNPIQPVGFDAEERRTPLFTSVALLKA